MGKPCIFCDPTQFQERLIGENGSYYAVATLGQITGGYTLIVPKQHVSCFGELPLPALVRLNEHLLDFAPCVCDAMTREYQGLVPSDLYPVTVFEHGIVGQTVKHAHLHVVPIRIDLTQRIHDDFPSAEFEELPYWERLPELYQQHPRPYLFWSRPNGTDMVCWDPPAPAQYLRIILAELLGRPERADWRTMDADLDRQLWSETVTRLKPYFS